MNSYNFFFKTKLDPQPVGKRPEFENKQGIEWTNSVKIALGGHFADAYAQIGAVSILPEGYIPWQKML